MPRTARHTPGGYVYHALNRATARLKLFRKAGDYAAFLRILDAAREKFPIRVLGYCLMPTHWHMVLYPKGDEDLTRFLRWLTLTHAVRWQQQHHATGSGHVYQNRFKAFAIEQDEHLYGVLSYVERNPLRAGLVAQAALWPWGSLACRRAAGEEADRRLAAWPVEMPENWERWVEEPQHEAELEAMRLCVQRGRPYGSERWVGRVVKRLGLVLRHCRNDG
jgi:putative transposase